MTSEREQQIAAMTTEELRAEVVRMEHYGDEYQALFLKCHEELVKSQATVAYANDLAKQAADKLLEQNDEIEELTRDCAKLRDAFKRSDQSQTFRFNKI